MLQVGGAICLVIFSISSAIAADLVGCGGFIQSDIPINYSQVEVALYTKDGIQKYRTDCAPNNGYFLIPLYEKGEFVLRVEPLEDGWMFRPKSVELNVDGVSDVCSRGEDINFVFAGFALTGRVISRGESSGPEGVSVAVRKVGSDDVVTTLTSGPGGAYQAPGLLPGRYTLTATHVRWHMDKPTTTVDLKDKNAVVTEPLVVAGYDVSGSVESDGKATAGVSFLLFGTPKVPVECAPVAEPSIDAGDVPGKLLCEAVSSADGRFAFDSLPLGEYHLKPYYRSKHITFDVLPKKMAFAVGHDSVTLSDPFRVHGFTVSGRVLSSASGEGIAGATITAKGVEKPSVTDANGQYLLEHVRPGVYHVTVEAKGYYFNPTDVTVSASAPQLENIVASEYALCGTVSISSPKGAAPLSSRRIELNAPGGAGQGQVVYCDDKGAFCFRVAPGKWQVSSVVSAADKSSGFMLHPSSQQVEVVDRPVRNVLFSQFFATLPVEVVCMSSTCSGLPIALQSVTRQDAKRVVLNAVQADEDSAQASVAFKDVLPGQYRLSILYDKWCWETATLDVNIGSENVEPAVFKQVGHLLKCLSSHALVLRYHLSDDDDDANGNDSHASVDVDGQTDLPVGSGQVCLPRSGIYELTTKSCHKFAGEPFTYSTAVPGVVSLTATAHSVSGSVVTGENSDTLHVSISAQSSGGAAGAAAVDLGPLTASKAKAEDGTAQYVYHYTHWAKSDDVLTVTPKLADMLFDPPQRSVTIPREACPERVAVFHGRRGVYVSGKVTPAVQGVKVTVTFKSGGEVVDLLTDSKGEYLHGPIDSSRQFSVSAFLDGYVIEPEAGSDTSFLVSKLGEINIAVSAAADKVPGVLVSLSGGRFRSNNFTNAEGRLRFLNLAPGQYFLRCMLKEYSFEPASQLIEVAEGGTVNVDISANRVSFSCYGTTRSLGGVAEAGITVVAAGLGDCRTSRESTESGSDGTFRLRALTPSCQYQIEVDSGSSASTLRSIPARRVITVSRDDVHGMDMVVFQPPLQVELSGYIRSNGTEHLSTVKVALFAEPHLTSSPIQTLTVSDQQPFFHFAPLPASSTPVTYRIALESSLSRSSYADLASGVQFTVGADQLHHHAVIDFNPRLLISETEPSLRHGSLLGVIMVAVLTLCVMNQQRLVSLVGAVIQSYPSSSNDPSPSRSSRRR